MKKAIIAGSIALFIALVAFFSCFMPFKINGDNSNLAEHTNQFLNRSMNHSQTVIQHSIKLYDSVTIGTKKYVLTEIDQQIGVIRLTKGLSGRYQIESVGYGGGNFTEEIVEISGGRYLLFGGRNVGSAIDKITFELDKKEYSLAIPKETRFFVYLEVDSNTKETHLDLEHLRFYNSNQDISEQVEWQNKVDE